MGTRIYSNHVTMGIVNNAFYTELTFSAMQKRVQTCNEKVFNKKG